MTNPLNIYEYDLKDCFNKIRISRLIHILRQQGLPTHLLTELRNLNGSSPKLPKEELLDESQARAKSKFQLEIDNFRASGFHSESQIQKMISEEAYLSTYLPKPGDLPGIFRTGSINNFLSMNEGQDEGLPQGSPTSPLLTILVISYSMISKFYHIMYADDGLLFDVTDRDIEYLDNRADGIMVNKEKSG